MMATAVSIPDTALPRTRDARGMLFAIAALVILLDRITKLLIYTRLHTGNAISLIDGVLRITHVRNTGAAFSIFQDTADPTHVRYALVGFSVFAVVVVLAMMLRIGHKLTATSVALALILGGALGNLYDRLRYAYVIDFIEVHIGSFHWPDFNVADSCIVIGACLLLIEIFKPPPAPSE